jgi:hypothetical protein
VARGRAFQVDFRARLPAGAGHARCAIPEQSLGT